MPWAWTSLLAATLLGPTIDLDWEAPAQCPARDQVVAELEQFLEAPDGSPAAEVHSVRARIQERDGVWVLHLRAEVEGGVLERSLEAQGCEVLASATALMISVLVHPAAVLERIEDSGARSTPDLDLGPSPRPKQSADPGPQGRARWRGGIRLDGGVTWGELPGPAAYTGLALVALAPHLRLELYAAFGWPRTGRPDPALSAGARVDGIWGGARGCYVVGQGAIQMPLCLGAEAGRLRARGVGVSQSARASSPWGAVLAGPRLGVRATRWLALLASVDGVVALTRPRFDVDGLGQAHRSASGGIRALLGVEVQFPTRSSQTRMHNNSPRRPTHQ